MLLKATDCLIAEYEPTVTLSDALSALRHVRIGVSAEKKRIQGATMLVGNVGHEQQNPGNKPRRIENIKNRTLFLACGKNRTLFLACGK